jgi:hypothetical protein
MKTYKEFINQIKPKEFVAFFNAGGRPGLYDNFEVRQKQTVSEDLNLRNEPEHSVADLDGVFRDPEKKHIDDDDQPIDREYPDCMMPCFPRLNREQALQEKKLIDNTDYNKTYINRKTHENVDLRDLMHLYTEGNSRFLNSALRDHHLDGITPPDDIEPFHVPTFDSIISDNRLPNNTTVYSGIHFNPNDHMGQIAFVPSYMSASLSPHVAKDFGTFYENNGNSVRHILRLHLPNGHPGYYVDPMSACAGQCEIILPRGMKIKLSDHPTHIIHNTKKSMLSHLYDDVSDDVGDEQPDEFHIWDGRIV